MKVVAVLLSLGLVCSALPAPNPAVPGGAVTHHATHTATTSHGMGGMGFGYNGGMGFGYGSALGGYGMGYPSLTGMGYGMGYPTSKQVTQVTTTAMRPGGMFGYF